MFSKAYNWFHHVSESDDSDHLKPTDVKSLMLLNKPDSLISPLGFECVFHLLSKICPQELQGSYLKSVPDYNPIDVLIGIMSQKDIVFESVDVIAHRPSTDITLRIIDNKLDHMQHVIVDHIASTQFINDLIMTKTRGLISLELDLAQIELVIMNVIYFLGKWNSPFDIGLNNMMPWNNGSKVKYMSKPNIYVPYARMNGLSVIELEYINSQFVFGIVLPNKDINSIMGNSQLIDCIYALKVQTRVNVTMPIFKVQRSNISDDVRAAFNITKGVCHYQQNTVMKVDTNGTEAAAVTYSLMDKCAVIHRKEAVDFVANKPFIYYVLYYLWVD
jgi:hypothetical protein